MIFETLWDSAKRGELLLVEGGMCHWHLRRDGQLTIREIISIKPGAGSVMLNMLLLNVNANSIVAKCPKDLESNSWYFKKGFSLVGQEVSKTGREINIWKLELNK